MIHHGDCLEVMAGMESESVDAIVTDPPYGLGFMGKAWDSQYRAVNDMAASLSPGERSQAWHQRWAIEALRVATPSAYLLAFGGTRTVHRMTVALEDAGWIIRDMLVWAYASGFPKSKASLKPAWEPIVMARKPGPLRMLAIDECRIPMVTVEGAGLDVNTHLRPNVRRTSDEASTSYSIHKTEDRYEIHAGRWPANVILTDPIFDGGVEGVVGGGETPHISRPASGPTWSGPSGSPSRSPMGGTDRDPQFYGDAGTHSRFFLVAKADRGDREPVLPEPFIATDKEWRDLGFSEGAGTPRRRNVHPTVKPTELMRHLVRLVTPAGGLVLDPFLGSGTTAIAAELEGFSWIGIEKEAEYVAIAEARLNGTQRGLGLSA